MRKTIFTLFVLTFATSVGFCQNSTDTLQQAISIYTGNTDGAKGLMGGFSLAGLIGSFLFGSIGFIAFMFGKKNSEFRPMMFGIALMAYPYFIRNTLFVYLIGAALTTSLFIFKE